MIDQLADTGEQSRQAYLYADIIIPLALPQNYTWRIPDQYAEMVKTGCRVEVTLRKNKKYAGVIKRLHQNKPEAFDPHPILNVLDAEPIVYDHQLKLWTWIAQYYMCSEGEVMAAALPSYFKLNSETVFVFNEEFGEDFSALDNDEFIIAEALSLKKELRLPEIQLLLDSAHIYPVIKRLVDRKVCYVWEALKDHYSVKKETYVILNRDYEKDEVMADLLNHWKRAPKQMELLLSYLHLIKTEGEVTKTSLLKKSGASDSQLKGLVEKNILWLEKRAIDRLRYLPPQINIDFTLSAAQQEAFLEINEAFKENPVCLLHGITSSGKTQVYIKLIEKYLLEGKQILYLLPEIALTSQIIRRLQKHFGGHIGIYHSKFNQNERIEIWNKIKSGELKIVLGARSALFLPFTDLGLIIVDEEHDTSFKQYEPAPRYNARDSSIYYAGICKAHVLLGSATPSFESYYNATQGKYGLVKLNERYGGVQLPTIELIDTRNILKNDKAKVILSPSLKESIDKSLQNGRQVILFQNRRGYSPYQICAACGWIPQCNHCDVSLTYHKLTNKLVCHYCGATYPMVTTCAACGSHHFIQRNFGTERIEESLEEVFPKAKIARMDIDSVRGKHAHDSLIQLFEQKRIDILVGTQMVVKGLDFDNVDLVGILDADSLLSFADFRVNERAFQLMEQVSGRAGRKDERGRVLIQTVNVKHPVLPFVQRHDYPALFKSEIETRERFFYPPFSRILKIIFRHKLKERVAEAARLFSAGLDKEYGKYLVGPAEPPVNRIRNQYLMELLIKIPKDNISLSRCKQAVKQEMIRLYQIQHLRSVVILPDVDPL